MEFVSILGVLARRRMLVALGVPLALLVGAMLSGMMPFGPGSGQGRVAGSAQTRLLLDRPNAVVSDVAEDSDTVSKQAALLAEFMSGDAQRDAVARRARIASPDLGMQRMQLVDLVARGQLPERTGQASSTLARPYVVNVSVATPLPVLTIDAYAPSAAEAARVADATRATLQALVADHEPTPGRRLVVKPLGAVRSLRIAASRRPPMFGVFAAFGFMVFWCCAVVVLHGLRARGATRRPSRRSPLRPSASERASYQPNRSDE
jgi:hypothetical protein